MMSCYACKISVVNHYLSKDEKTLIMECVVDDGKQKHIEKFFEKPEDFKDVIDQNVDKFHVECIKVNYQYKITKRI